MMKKSLRQSAIIAAFALSVAACGQSKQASADEAPADDAAEQASAAAGADSDGAAGAALAPDTLAKAAIDNARESEKFLEDNARKKDVHVTESGLQYMVLEEGPADGASPNAQDIVDVNYAGTLLDGVEFDSSYARGAAARFPVNQVIDGWTEALQLMSEGDKYRLFLPPELAYGEQGTPGGPIGPNEALIFDVELIKVTSAEGNLKKSEEFLAENAKRQGVATTASGLQYEVLVEGESGGNSPTDANVVKVNYEGRLIDGKVFDSSYERGEPIEFPLARVIAGWTEGVQLMSVGDKFRFFIPPDLAYGARGTPGGPIGPNEALIFDVELLDVVD
ncbi:MAG: FKBP-type peptidyl-prolyl cis-trans isomerase [Parvularculaceae bacterium]